MALHGLRPVLAGYVERVRVRVGFPYVGQHEMTDPRDELNT